MRAGAKDQPKADEAAVRPKASKRKVRAESFEHKARPPAQERSQRRFQAILDAAEDLLRTSNIEDVSFHDIAARAGVSPASVHYHFPSMAALRIELVRAYNESATASVIDGQRKVAAEADPRWQGRVRSILSSTRDYFNEHRHVCEVLLGPSLHRDARFFAMEYNEKAAQALLDGMRAVFIVPEVPGLLEKWVVTCEVTDALWSRSYLKHGRITDEAFEESVHLVTSYLRSLLPETLPLRPREPRPSQA